MGCHRMLYIVRQHVQLSTDAATAADGIDGGAQRPQYLWSVTADDRHPPTWSACTASSSEHAQCVVT